MIIGCLQTAQSNANLFDQNLMALGRTGLDIGQIKLVHHVMPRLLDAAIFDGGLTLALAHHVAGILADIARDCDFVLLTCSTLGPAADQGDLRITKPCLRIDRALSDTCRQRGGHYKVLAAIDATLIPTQMLFGPSISVELVADAWAQFQAGDLDQYYQTIARAADRALADGWDYVALAQASMAPAADLCSEPQNILTSPRAGLLLAINS